MSGRTTVSLSKSKLLAYRQCARRLWLEVNKKELLESSEEAEARFEVGHQIGTLARRLYDPSESGTVIDVKAQGVSSALKFTQSLLPKRKPLFEAGFSSRGALAFADVLLPRGRHAWRLVEVKSSGSVKPYHINDASIQYFIAAESGLSISAVSIAHIDTKWVYSGGDDYDGLLKEVDITSEAKAGARVVKAWISDAQAILRKRTEPKMLTGDHCSNPFECGFTAHCSSTESQPKFSASILPRVQTKALKKFLAERRGLELEEVPDELLSERQLRVKQHTLSSTVFFDAKAAALALERLGRPTYFMDFETVSFAIPIWSGTRPYQQIPFQFSVQILGKSGDVREQQFLDLSGNDPSEHFSRALVATCKDRGPIFVYNAAFEIARIKELAERFKTLRKSLLALIPRVFDLRPVAENFYYHPAQRGSWSLKAVLPNIAPAHRYDALDGVQDGGDASNAYLEAISPTTASIRRNQIREQLAEYCRLDTLALLAMFGHFKGSV
jgi:hypothetical protein